MYYLIRQYLYRIKPPKTECILLGIGLFSFLLYLMFFNNILHFNMFRSDVEKYWNFSLKWKTLFNTWWVPGYSMLLAGGRAVTFNHFSPIVTMCGISLISFLITIHVIYSEAVRSGCTDPFFVTLFFIFFPFVGLNYSVFPMADITAISFLLLSVQSANLNHIKRFTVFASLSLLTHKIMWFFVAPILLWKVITHKLVYPYIVLVILPLIIWMIMGTRYHEDPLWFMRWSYHFLFEQKKMMPIFDGLITPLASGSPFKVIKGIIILSIIIVSSITFVYSIRTKQWISAGISATLLFIALTVNYFEIWVVARFSKLLVIPLIAFYSNMSWLKRKRTLWILILLFSLLSNVLFSFYMARIFYVNH